MGPRGRLETSGGALSPPNTGWVRWEDQHACPCPGFMISSGIVFTGCPVLGQPSPGPRGWGQGQACPSFQTFPRACCAHVTDMSVTAPLTLALECISPFYR